MLTLILFTSILFLFHFFQDVPPTDTAEMIATTIAGIVAPILAQLAKRLFGTTGVGSLILAIVVSAITAVGALWYAGEIHTFGDVLKQISAVFGIATVVYKLYTAATEPAKV